MENGRMIVEYIGPNRTIDTAPRKSDNVYDPNIGRTKPETIHWRAEGDRIVSQPIDAGFASKLIRSSMNPKGSPHFVEYEPNKKPKLVEVQSTHGDAALKEEVTQLKKKLEERDRQILRLNEVHGRVQETAPQASSKKAEQESLSPQKDRLSSRLKGAEHEESQIQGSE